jgi:FMN-dependent NADH-azoreductase
MATNLLHVIATPRGLASNTGRVSAALIEELHQRHRDLDVTTLDLFRADLPAVAGANIESKYALMTGQQLDDGARESWRDIERTIEQFLAADIYVLTVPMWNFGIPYALKYYIDAIVQPGYLFHYDETGQPVGLVHGKQMVCVTSRGGDYSQAPMAALDHMVGYLSTIFGFVGITDLTFFNAQPMDIDLELRNTASKAVIEEMRAWVGRVPVG